MRTLALSFLTIFITALCFSAQTFESGGRSEVFSIAGGSSFSMSMGRAESSKAGAAYDVERIAFDMLNKKRAERGLSVLQWDETIAEFARSHSAAMATQNFFSHRSKDGKLVDERADLFGLTQWRSIGENIAFVKGVAKPAELAVEKWMESASHRNNILRNNWSESGIGVAIAPDNTYYFTQVFLVK